MKNLYVLTLALSFLASTLTAQTLIDMDFSTDTTSDWTPVASATNTSEASISWNATGGTSGGALEISGENLDGAGGRAFIFMANVPVSPFNGQDLTFSFDIKSNSVVGSGVHFESHDPVSPTQIFDMQAKGMNDSTWTTFTANISGAAAAGKSNFQIQFNLAAGAFEGAGGTILVDNIKLTQVPEPSTYAAIAGLLVLGFAVVKRRK